MKYDPDRHHRRSIRLQDYNYSQECGYFVTICTHERGCLFGEVRDGEMRLNAPGTMVVDALERLNQSFPEVKIDAYIVMPNHIHCVIWLVGAPLVGALDPWIGSTTGVAPALGGVVGAFKSITTDEYIHGVKALEWLPFSGRLWQRNYYEHVLRNEKSLNAIREYIQANPSQWANDPDNPDYGH
jgi:putative transposase